MQRFILFLAVVLLVGGLPISAQQKASTYEAEFLSNPNKSRKDTREVNAVLIFENDSVRIISRRGSQVFREFKYSEIEWVEHSFSKNPFFSDITRETVLAALIAPSLWYEKKEKHWLTILGENDFAVLKIENDNYRLIKMEFLVRELKIENVNEDRR